MHLVLLYFFYIFIAGLFIQKEMEMVWSLTLGVGSMVLAILWYHSLFETVAFGIIYISVCILGMFVGLKWFLMRGQSYHAALPTQKPSLVSLLVQKMMVSIN